MNQNRVLKVSLLDAIESLARRKVFILSIAFVAAAVAVIVSLLLTPIYTATTVLMPPSSSSETSLSRIMKDIPLGKLAGASLLSSGMPSDLTNVYTAILDSRTLRLEMIQHFQLAHVYEFDKRKRYFIEDLLQALDKNIGIDISDEGTIDIDVDDKSPERAADMANFMASQLDDIYKRLTTEKNRDYRIFLGERLDSVKAGLEIAEKNMVDFQKRNHMVNIAEQAKASISAGADLEARYLGTRMNLDIARKTYSDDDPRVKELTLEMEQLEKQRRELSQNRTSDLLIPFDAAPDIELEYLRLERDLGVQQTLFELITQQFEQAKFEESQNTPNVQILDPAQPPQKKKFPKRSSIVVLTFALSLLLSSVFVLFQEFWQQFRREHPGQYARLARVLEQLWLGRRKTS